jgi:cobalt-zinc-cadmium efflux system membrane fusion protein
MKKIFYSALFLLLAIVSFAHEGEDHGVKKAAVPAGMKYFSSEVLSDKYEVL